MEEKNHSTRRVPRAEERFREEWNRWLQRPMKMDGRQAADRIAEKLRTTPPKAWRWIPAGAVAALVLMSFLLFRLPTDSSPEIPIRSENGSAAESGAQSSAGKNQEVLMWIDEKTPLYMTFQYGEE